MNHFVRKSDILRGLVTGKPQKALCGVMVQVTSQGVDAVPGHEVANKRLSRCPECDLFYDALPASAKAIKPARQEVSA